MPSLVAMSYTVLNGEVVSDVFVYIKNLAIYNPHALLVLKSR